MGQVMEVLEPVERLRLPAELEGRQGVESSRPTRHRRGGWRIFMVTMVVLALSVLVAERMASPPSETAPHRYWVEGMVERLQTTPSGASTITVMAVTGRVTTATLDFGQTSVFHQGKGVCNIAHLKLGQQVRLLHERGGAKSIAILR